MVRDDDQDMAGHDGLSGAGRFLASRGEEPPPALDAVILQAAREALREERARGSRRRLLWPLAASLLLSTTAVLMFGPDAPQRESAALVTEEGLRPRTLEAAGRSGETLPRAVSSEVPPSTPAQPEPRRAPASTAAEAQTMQESGSPPPTQERGAITAARLQPDTPPPQSVQESVPPEEAIADSGFRIRQLPPDSQPLQEAGPIEALEEIAVAGARIRQEDSDSQSAQEAAPAAALEEIAVTGAQIERGSRNPQPTQETGPAEQEEIFVTGSRVRLAEPGALNSAPADFSEDPELWRAAIQILLEAGLVELAREEREQFLQRYPELDPGPWPEAAGEGQP